MAQGLAKLQHGYRDRWQAAVTAKAQGAKVVGLVGPVPVELVLAAGGFPMQVTAAGDGPTPAADIYMDDVISPEIHALFEMAHRGDLAGLDLLVLTRPYDKLYYYLKEVRRLGRGENFPAVHMFDVLQSQREAVRAYNRGQFDALTERLARLCAHTPTEGGLADALQKTDAVRALQRRVLDQRSAGLWTGADALAALSAGRFMDIDAYTAALKDCVEERLAAPRLAHRPQLLVISSEPLSNTTLFEMLEGAGGLVVSEDDLWGARAADEQSFVGKSAFETVFERAWTATPTSAVYPPQARQAWFQKRAAAADIDAVVFYVPPSDHLFGWDYPAMSDFVSVLRKPHLLIRHEATDPRTAETAADFFSQLKVSA